MLLACLRMGWAERVKLGAAGNNTIGWFHGDLVYLVGWGVERGGPCVSGVCCALLRAFDPRIRSVPRNKMCSSRVFSREKPGGSAVFLFAKRETRRRWIPPQCRTFRQ